MRKFGRSGSVSSRANRVFGAVLSARSMVVTASLLAAAPVFASQAAPPLGKAELASLIAAERAAHPSIQASVRVTREGGANPGLFDMIEESISVEAGGIAIRRLRTYPSGSGAAGLAGPPSWDTLSAADGAEILVSRVGDDTALIGTDPDLTGGSGTTAWSSELLWHMLWLPASGLASTPHPGDVLAVLAAPTTSVGSLLEEVDGHPCVVLVVHRGDGAVDSRIWLDGSVGWLPRLQRSYAPDGSLDLERRVLEFTPLPSGAYVPSVATTFVAADGQGLVPEDSRRTMTLVDPSDAAWAWPAVTGAGLATNVASVRDVVPPDQEVLVAAAKAKGADDASRGALHAAADAPSRWSSLTIALAGSAVRRLLSGPGGT